MQSIQRIISYCGFILSLAAMPAWAADQFIMRADLNYAQEIAARFGLLLVRQIEGQTVFLVQGPESIGADQLMAAIRNYDHGDNDNDDDEDDDVEIERNVVVSLPELDTPFPRLIGATNLVQQALNDRSSRNYFGDTVWSSYVV